MRAVRAIERQVKEIVDTSHRQALYVTSDVLGMLVPPPGSSRASRQAQIAAASVPFRSAADCAQIPRNRSEIVAVNRFHDGVPLAVHGFWEPGSENRTCYRSNGVAITPDVCSNKNRGLSRLHQRPERQRERHDR